MNRKQLQSQKLNSLTTYELFIFVGGGVRYIFQHTRHIRYSSTPHTHCSSFSFFPRSENYEAKNSILRGFRMGPNRVVEAISCDLRGSVKQKFSRYAPRQLMGWRSAGLDCLLIRPASNAVIIKVALTGEKVPHPCLKETFKHSNVTSKSAI